LDNSAIGQVLLIAKRFTTEASSYTRAQTKALSWEKYIARPSMNNPEQQKQMKQVD
jgi:hypothetical protein